MDSYFNEKPFRQDLQEIFSLLFRYNFFGLRSYDLKPFRKRYYYLSKETIMSTSPKAMLFSGLLPESLKKIQLILLILSIALIKIESIPLICCLTIESVKDLNSEAPLRHKFWLFRRADPDRPTHRSGGVPGGRRRPWLQWVCF